MKLEAIHKLKFSHLEAFVAVFQVGSITSAATDLGLSAGGLGVIIKEAEEILGNQLFARSRMGVVPTEYARKVYQESFPVVQSFAGLREALAGDSIKAIGKIGLGILPGLPGTLITRTLNSCLKQCSKEHPNFRITVTESNGALLLDAIQKRALDFALMQTTVATQGFYFTELINEKLMVVGSKRLLGDMQRISSPSALNKLPLILQTTKGSMRSLLAGACQSQGFALTPKYEIDSIALQLQICGSSQGVAILPASACLNNPTLRHLAYVPILINGISRSLYLAQPGAHLAPEAKIVASILRENMKAEVLALNFPKLISLVHTE